ncbi:hypothetical protein, partial [Mesorhizobium sp. M0870]|uniref:hypothetical protein n=1 Tax=Mesorhizobium sp. M0870 TaxID=2957016 RepID=UPI00333C746D
MELDIRKTADPTSGGLIMQRNKVHHVYTGERVARDLGVSEALIQDLTLGLEPEDGVIWVYGANDDDGILASPMKASKNSSSKNINASPHRKLDPSTPVLRSSWPPDTHVCGLHRMRTIYRGGRPLSPRRRWHGLLERSWKELWRGGIPRPQAGRSEFRWHQWHLFAWPAVLRSGVPNGTSLHADCVFRTSSKGN